MSLVSSDKRSRKQLLSEIEARRARVDEAEQTLEAIRRGEVDAFIVEGPQGEQVFSLSGVERIYRIIVETMNEAALTVTHDGTVLFCNRRLVELLKIPSSEIIGRPLADFIEERHKAGLMELLDASQTGPSRRRLLLRMPDGSVVPVQFSGTFLPAADGPAICLVATDLTQTEAAADFIEFLEKHREELKASRDRLKESEARFRQMADNLPFLVWLVDAHGRLEFVNRTYCEFFGISENEVLNDRWQMLVHPEEADIYLGEFFDSLRERRIFRAQTRVKNVAGAWRWVESVGRPRFSESGDFLGLVGASPDITESKQAEYALRNSEKRLQLLYETGALLLRVENPQQVIGDIARKVMEHLDCQFFFNFLVDAESGRLKLNACAGISAETANSIRILDYGVAVCGCVARDGQRIVVDNILDSQDPMTELIRGFGIQAYCCHPMMGKGKLLGTLSFGTSTRPQFDSYDVDLMQVVTGQTGVAIERLWARETMESMVQERTASLLAANRELELRTTQLRRLAAEMTMAEQRERKRLAQVLHDGLQQYLAAIKLQVGELSTSHEAAEAHQVEAMLGEAIQMSRSLSTELSPPILYERGLISALEWFGRTMRDQYGFKVNCRTRSEVELSEEWRVMLFQSARELLFNAAKHSGAKSADVDVQVRDGTLWISISDSGCGFDPQLLVAGGTEANGFGIFSIRERLGLLGGFLKIESAPGSGSRFTMKVPFSPPEKKGDTPQTPIFGKPIRVLLADDHALFRDGLDRLFRKTRDIQVVGHAVSGQDAIARAAELKPDVILMDVDMPEMNGIDATQAICGSHPGIRIIGLSMYEEDLSAQRMRQAGAVDYVCKSSSATELLAAIRRSCNPTR